jgi:hypothetical protein
MGIRQDRELIDALCEIDHGLTEWEVEFVEDMARQVHDQKRGLTPGQLAKALEIHDEHL